MHVLVGRRVPALHDREMILVAADAPAVRVGLSAKVGEALCGLDETSEPRAVHVGRFAHLLHPRREPPVRTLRGEVTAVGSTGLTIWLGIRGYTVPGMEEMAAQFNLPGRIYPQATILSTLLGPSVVFLFSVLAAVYPAWRLRRLHPVEAMRAN